jgi:hypothetical protein
MVRVALGFGRLVGILLSLGDLFDHMLEVLLLSLSLWVVSGAVGRMLGWVAGEGVQNPP